MSLAVSGELERYVRTGDSDPHCGAWQGTFMERANRAHEALRGALLDEVRRRAMGRSHVALPETDTVALTRAKVEPMVRGLFPRVEQDAVLAALERSVVFVTSASIEGLLLGGGFDSTAWTLANLYLASVGAELLAKDEPRLVGLSVDTTCYVSPGYFADDDPFADFIVHEATHIFHNCKRATIGLRGTRTREWLLDIDYQKRETFAYSCEAFARVVERGKGGAGRLALAEEFSAGDLGFADDRVEEREVAGIVKEAAGVRNG